MRRGGHRVLLTCMNYALPNEPSPEGHDSAMSQKVFILLGLRIMSNVDEKLIAKSDHFADSAQPTIVGFLG